MAEWNQVPLNEVAAQIEKYEQEIKILKSEVETMTNAYDYMKEKSKTKITLDSIPPGFIILRYEGEMPDPGDLVFSTEDRQRWNDMGYFGGICLPKDWDVKSYSNEELGAMGLQRLPFPIECQCKVYPCTCGRRG